MRAKTGYRGKRVGYGRINDSKIMFLRTLTTKQLSVMEVDPDDYDAEEVGFTLSSEKGNAYILYIPVPGRPRPLTWDISGMTTEELEATRKFFTNLFDLAEPVVRERDKVAADAFAKGDDSYSRGYRQLPQLIVRQRTKRTDGEGVLDGPEDASSGHGDGPDLG